MMFSGLQVMQLSPRSTVTRSVASTGGSAVIPPLGHGGKAKWVYCVATLTAGSAVGRAATVAPDHAPGSGNQNTDIPVPIDGRGVILNVAGYSRIRYDLLIGTGDTGARLSFTPLENQ